ncbi:MAG: diaminopimelate epimerase [Candidatus Methanofastidiosia archaeon]
MKFIKMEGLGNDYIYIDLFSEKLPSVNLNNLAKKLSDRHFRIGGDGLVLIERSKKADCRMRIFNSDGSESQMCGNAVRCIAKVMFDNGRTCNGKVSIETLAGIVEATVVSNDRKAASVEVIMGKPQLLAKEIPSTIETERIISYPLDVGGRNVDITCVSMGNPHCVIFVDELLGEYVGEMGRKIENHPVFPEKTNVEFVKILSKDNVEMRVWERGVGETLACGSGACAALVAGVLNNHCNRKAEIKLLGGKLEVEWLGNGKIRMLGPAVKVFEGEIQI